ncbi:protein of unknown function [Trichlorobacter ammonificans]|uniref:Uncharacterized protein n=1 Tax=Trichlorobacter ammonificans TaxID=2916410 RepID=A0ABM9D4I0_9BACT|nr:protein of unknown function [Trichlorobacter ammonificans]
MQLDSIGERLEKRNERGGCPPRFETVLRRLQLGALGSFAASLHGLFAFRQHNQFFAHGLPPFHWLKITELDTGQYIRVLLALQAQKRPLSP